MIEKEQIFESDSYPIVEVICDHCQKKFVGKIGPIEAGESFVLHKYKDKIVGTRVIEQILPDW